MEPERISARPPTARKRGKEVFFMIVRWAVMPWD